MGKDTISQFISYYPLKQGLKPFHDIGCNGRDNIYILLSIKTRIETLIPRTHRDLQSQDLYPTIH